MSQKLDELRQLIRELVEEELEELTGTGNVAGFYTPFAFQGSKASNKAKRKETASQAGYVPSPESGEEEDNEIFEATNISGWSVEDISFVTRGADPTYYQRYILRKGNKVYKVEEFFGDYYISTDLKSKGRGPYTSKQADQLLRQVGAPTTDKIERSGKRYESIKEAGDPYYPWRNDETQTPRMKIGKAITEINKTLKEAEKVVKRCGRLKKEMGMSANDYWKRTNGALLKIEQRVHNLASRVREMRV